MRRRLAVDTSRALQQMFAEKVQDILVLLLAVLRVGCEVALLRTRSQITGRRGPPHSISGYQI